MAAAAEKRLQQEEGRGLKDPEGYKRKIEQREKLQNETNTATGEAPLKVRKICWTFITFLRLWYSQTSDPSEPSLYSGAILQLMTKKKSVMTSQHNNEGFIIQF